MAGRPAMPDEQKKVKLKICLEPEVFAEVKKHGNRSRFINKVLKEYIDFKREQENPSKALVG